MNICVKLTKRYKKLRPGTGAKIPYDIPDLRGHPEKLKEYYANNQCRTTENDDDIATTTLWNIMEKGIQKR